MSTSIYYGSLRTLSDAERAAIEAAAGASEQERTWSSCEPVHFYPSDGGYLRGGSKPNLAPNDDEGAAATASGLPDGTVLDLIEVLTQLSRDHGVDWEITFEQGPPIGFIRNGHCDPEVLAGAQQLVEVARMLAAMSM